MKSYLNFEQHPTPPGKRIKVWTVLNTTGMILGGIHWWPAWRKYVFTPVADSVFDITCLRDIADFLRKEQEAHMAALAANKE